MARVSRELHEAEQLVAKIKDGLLAAYETIEIGKEKLARAEARVAEIKSRT